MQPHFQSIPLKHEQTAENLNDSERLLTVLAQVPAGSVVAFGDLAAMAGYPGRARWVGQVLSKLPANTAVPWHRVVNSQGHLTCPRSDLASERLITEGVAVQRHRVDMERYRWHP